MVILFSYANPLLLLFSTTLVVIHGYRRNPLDGETDVLEYRLEGDSDFQSKRDPGQNLMWIGPRLGRRKRSEDENVVGNVVLPEKNGRTVLEFLQDSPWAFVAVKGGKRRTVNFIPRLGRDSEEEYDNSVDSSFSKSSSRSGNQLAGTFGSGNNFTPRLGRSGDLLRNQTERYWNGSNQRLSALWWTPSGSLGLKDLIRQDLNLSTVRDTIRALTQTNKQTNHHPNELALNLLQEPNDLRRLKKKKPLDIIHPSQHIRNLHEVLSMDTQSLLPLYRQNYCILSRGRWQEEKKISGHSKIVSFESGSKTLIASESEPTEMRTFRIKLKIRTDKVNSPKAKEIFIAIQSCIIDKCGAKDKFSRIILVKRNHAVVAPTWLCKLWEQLL